MKKRQKKRKTKEEEEVETRRRGKRRRERIASQARGSGAALASPDTCLKDFRYPTPPERFKRNIPTAYLFWF